MNSSGDAIKLQQISTRLSSIPWLKLKLFEEATSTMDLARNISSELGQNEVGMALTLRQTNGRGRLGRTWLDTEGAFLGTLVHCTNLDISKYSGFSLAVGLMISNVLLHFGVNTNLKWPNDVMDQESRKLGGVLIELNKQDRTSYISTGIGINLRNAPDNFQFASSVWNSSGHEIEISDFTYFLLTEFKLLIEEFDQKGFKGFKDDWKKKAIKVSEKVKISYQGKTAEGIFRDVNNEGAILLDVDGKIMEVSSGEITI